MNHLHEVWKMKEAYREAAQRIDIVAPCPHQYAECAQGCQYPGLCAQIAVKRCQNCTLLFSPDIVPNNPKEEICWRCVDAARADGR